MDKSPQVTLNTTAHYFLEGLNELGMEYLFCNLGTDHAPIIEEMARWTKLGRKFPATILCPHENTAMHMAAGYAAVTGRGQGVLVHVDAGTANCAMGAHNIRRSRLPLMLMAGKAPFSVRGELPGSRDNYVHFIQEPYDQGAIVRPYVKWEWTLPSGAVTKEVLRRAHTMAHSDPQGPVYLMLPRETLAQEWDDTAIRSFSAERYGAVRAGAATSEAVTTLVDKLLAATYPVMVSTYAGRNPQAPVVIEELARFCGMRVMESHTTAVNIPRDSDFYFGGNPADYVGNADMGLLVDVDVPWIPKLTRENPNTWWGHIDVDVVKEDFPMWGFSSDLRVQGDATTILRQVLAELKVRAPQSYLDSAAKRRTQLAVENAERRAKIVAQAADPGKPGAINAHYFCAALSKQLGADDIVVNEAVRSVGIVLSQVPRTKPGTYIGFAGGGLGCSAGLALGAKLGRPNSTVVQFVGDGGFYFNNPSSTFAVSKQYNVPILMVVIDNGGWSAVKEATLRMHPDGDAAGSNQFQARLTPDVNFADVVRSVGGHGETILDPKDVEAGIARALAAVRGGRPGLIHVKIPTI
jgi:acetolactate synthase I/II/III large subunit